MDQELSTNLTVGDLKLLASLIELCSARGVLRANELVVIGDLYNKLTACLANITNDIDKGNQAPGS